MTAYTTYPSTRFAVKKPIDFELMAALYNNPLAIAEGATGAPRINRRAITPGGSEIDGVIDNASVMPTLPGFYEWDSLTLTTPKTLPCATIIRIDSNVVLSTTLTVSAVDAANRAALETYFRAVSGTAGVAGGNNTGTGGGGSVGAGGAGTHTAGGAGKAIAGLRRTWLNFLPILGGNGGTANGVTVNGGGSIILMINGNLDMSGGGVINAKGADGFDGGTVGPGGGGGGSIIVVCNGTITGGTFNADGGGGGDSNTERGGGGGGGYVALIAAAFAGVQTKTAAGGAPLGGGGGGGALSGSAGTVETETLLEGQINGLLLR